MKPARAFLLAFCLSAAWVNADPADPGNSPKESFDPSHKDPNWLVNGVVSQQKSQEEQKVIDTKTASDQLIEAERKKIREQSTSHPTTGPVLQPALAMPYLDQSQNGSASDHSYAPRQGNDNAPANTQRSDGTTVHFNSGFQSSLPNPSSSKAPKDNPLTVQPAWALPQLDTTSQSQPLPYKKLSSDPNFVPEGYLTPDQRMMQKNLAMQNPTLQVDKTAVDKATALDALRKAEESRRQDEISQGAAAAAELNNRIPDPSRRRSF